MKTLVSVLDLDNVIVGRPRRIFHRILTRMRPTTLIISLNDVKRSEDRGVRQDETEPQAALSDHVGCVWWSLTESNRRHPACKAGALPTELRPHLLPQQEDWWVEEDLNLRPHAYQACALTT